MKSIFEKFPAYAAFVDSVWGVAFIGGMMILIYTFSGFTPWVSITNMALLTGLFVLERYIRNLCVEHIKLLEEGK